MKNIKMLIAVAISILFAGEILANEQISALEAKLFLQQGNDRFYLSKTIHPNLNAERIKETAYNGQSPFAIVVSESDSRLPVSLVFDHGVGDIYSVRSELCFCEANQIASIEWALQKFEAPYILVLVSSQSDAVSGVLKKSGEVHPYIENKLQPVVARVKEKHKKLKGEALKVEVIRERVLYSIEFILKRSAVVRQKLEEGAIILEGAIYDVESGKVNWLGVHGKQREMLAANKGKKSDLSGSGVSGSAGDKTKNYSKFSLEGLTLVDYAVFAGILIISILLVIFGFRGLFKRSKKSE